MDFEEEIRKDTSSEEARLTRLIEAIARLLDNKDWRTTHELHFQGEEERINRLLFNEAKRDKLDEVAIYRLQGELKWAKRYSDIGQFGKILKNQLDKLK